MTRRALIAAIAMSTLMAACGGGGADPAATTTTASTTTVPPPTTTTTTTRPPTTTTRPPTTTTTTIPPPGILAWDGDGVFELSLAFGFEPSHLMTERNRMTRTATVMLERIGVTVVLGSDAVLRFDLVGEGLAASYQGVGRCYEGARVTAAVTLSSPDHPDVTLEAVGTVSPPERIFASSCARSPEDVTEYGVAFGLAAMMATTDLWGADAVPNLVADLTQDYEGRYLWDQLGAIQAFGTLDPAIVPKDDAARFLGAVIDLVEYLVTESETESLRDEAEAAREAARNVLAEYAGSDFGVTTGDDVTEWRDWLAGW